MNERVRVELKDIQTTIYHDELTSALVERAIKLLPIVRELFTDMTVEKWVDGFMCDFSPEREIAIWEEACKEYSNEVRGRQVSPEEKKEIWGKILLMMNEKCPIVLSEKPIPFA